MQGMEKETGREIAARREALSRAVVERQYGLQPEIWDRYGDEGRAKSVRDAGYHFSYLAEALAAADPSLFADYAVWVRVLFAGLGMPDPALIETLQCTQAVLEASLPPEMAAVAGEYVTAALRRVRSAPAELPTFVQEGQPLSDLARQYVAALLRSDRRAASRLILEAVEGGTSVRDVYLHVFQPAQHEIGRLWQMNEISVAQEHYCTAATQLIMSQLYPYIFGTERAGRTLVAACVGGELHEVGMRMVADFFEMEGWDTYYLGANTPTESVVQAVTEHKADVLGVSATITFHLGAVTELIERVRAGVGHEVKILVGGYPFNVSPQLWQEVGADGFAPNAQQAVSVAERMVASGSA